eukprot:7874039-Lingulodinium_polyedra.AAC.1
MRGRGSARATVRCLVCSRARGRPATGSIVFTYRLHMGKGVQAPVEPVSGPIKVSKNDSMYTTVVSWCQKMQ